MLSIYNYSFIIFTSDKYNGLLTHFLLVHFNMVALKRNDFPVDVMRALADAHRLIYRARVGLDHAREILRSESKLLPQVNQLLEFVQQQQEGRFGRARQRRAA